MIQNLGFPEIQVRFSLILTLVFLFLFLIAPMTVFAQHDHGNSIQKPVQNLEELRVIASKVNTFIQQNPSQIISMDALEIETRNFLQVHEVLGAMPGVDVKQSTGGLGTRISIRGGGGSGSVLVLINGRPAATMQYGGVDLNSIPIDIVEKITVFKPPVPVWLGLGSAAGAIYIETKDKKIRERQKTTGKVRASAGSFGLFSSSATGQFDSDKSQVLVSGGYFHRDGRRDNSQKDQGHMSLGYDKKERGSHLQINGKAFISDHGVSGPDFNPTPNAKQRYEMASLDMKYDGFLNAVDYAFKTWADLKKLNETANNGLEYSLETFSTGLGSDFSIIDDSEEKELKLGGLAEQNHVDHTQTGRHDRTRLSAHSEARIRTDPMVYTIGTRAEYTNDFHFSPAGYTGFIFSAFKNTRIHANAGYSEHVPSFGQLYQPIHGSVDQVRGNSELDKERILSLTAGMEHQFKENHVFSLSLFRTDTWDLIKYQRDINLVYEPINIDQAYKQGLETLLKIALSENTNINVSYIWQDTKNKENSKKLSYAPEHILKLIWKTQFRTGTHLEWTTRGYSEQFSDNLNAEEKKLSAYLTTDVKITHPISIFENKALIFCDIHNLFDKDYSSHYGYPDDGIKWEVGFSINF